MLRLSVFSVASFCSVHTPGWRRILQSVSGFVPSGEMMALLGSSGAGKSSLLDILCQRSKIGAVGGEIVYFAPSGPLSQDPAKYIGCGRLCVCLPPPSHRGNV